MTPIMSLSHRIQYVLICLIVLWCAGFVLAPVLEQAGTDVSLVRSFYGKVCHQIEPRSFLISGKPLAVCVRCSAIYLGFLTGCFVGMFVGYYLGSFLGSEKWQVGIRFCAIGAGIVVAADVGFDLLGVLPNTVLSRVASGGLFGVVLALLVVPMLIEAVSSLLTKLNKR